MFDFKEEAIEFFPDPYLIDGIINEEYRGGGTFFFLMDDWIFLVSRFVSICSIWSFSFFLKTMIRENYP